MRDLFASDATLEPVQMGDSDVHFLVQFPMPMSNGDIFTKLDYDTVWLHEEIFVWGKRHFQPRLTAWHAEPGKSYTYSGAVMFPMPWTNLLLSIKRELEALTGASFNSVLLNKYRDNNDRMGFHSDNEPSLGRDPVIASLSYGATGTIIFKHKRGSHPDKKIRLTSGSLLLMKGLTQMHWKHGINREIEKCGPRINLTFRNILK
jgi:alkylated DNA repair dioxygenase AlkB